MGESPGSPPKQEDGELSNDGDLSHLFVVDSTPTETYNRVDVPVYDKVKNLRVLRFVFHCFES